MAGSLGLNKRFEEAVKGVVGEDQYYHLRKTKDFEQATLQFDRSIKTAFRGSPDEDYYVNFPMAQLMDDPGNNLVSSCWNMTGCVESLVSIDQALTLYRADVQAIFDPIIIDIERLVDDQVNLVKVKRMSGNHPKADEIKVGALLHLWLNHLTISHNIGHLSGWWVRIEPIPQVSPRGRSS
jgi:hypothetical protein